MPSPYANRLAELRGSLREVDARSGRISSLRGLTFLATVGFASVRAFGPVPLIVWALAGTSGAIFVALVIAHAVLVTRGSSLEARVRLCERGERRIAGDFASFPEKGDRFIVGGHAYEGDLDIFGAASLFQLVGAAETGPGEEMLARWLAAPASAGEIASRQEAVRELDRMGRFREDLAAAGVASGTRGRGADRFLEWAEARERPNAALLFAGRALVLVTLATFAVPRALDLTGWVSLLWLGSLAAQLLVLFVLRPSLEPVLAPASSREAPFGRYVALFRLVEATSFDGERLTRVKGDIAGAVSLGETPKPPLAAVSLGETPKPPLGAVSLGETPKPPLGASRELARLETVLGFAEIRAAGIVGILANVFLLWDVFCAVALLRWRERSGAAVRRWLDALAELDALAALATFANEHPDYAFPEVTAGELHFIAEDLGHPLLAPTRRVSNDVALDGPGSTLMITGSNMSGKSTMLRALGVNAVLAFAGAPVCARSLRVSTCQVRSSMRISDSLEDGVSHFYAELGRLKAVVDAVDRGERVLFLLDEVLHGTNSRERIIGAKAVVRHLIDKGAIGGVSSHDLGLASLAAEGGGRVRNVHFQEAVDGEKMTFDYKLKEGVVTSSNALRLMRAIGIGVELPDE